MSIGILGLVFYAILLGIALAGTEIIKNSSVNNLAR